MSESNDVSMSNPGPNDDCPYIPSWCYDAPPTVCVCGDHEGYHDDAGVCLRRAKCGCTGFRSAEDK